MADARCSYLELHKQQGAGFRKGNIESNRQLIHASIEIGSLCSIRYANYTHIVHVYLTMSQFFVFSTACNTNDQAESTATTTNAEMHIQQQQQPWEIVKKTFRKSTKCNCWWEWVKTHTRTQPQSSTKRKTFILLCSIRSYYFSFRDSSGFELMS